jgi:cell division protein YceG involved in septum cleavage
VADSKNSHYFSKTYKEHLNKIKELGLDQWI